MRIQESEAAIPPSALPRFVSETNRDHASDCFFGDCSADGNYEVTLMTKATVYYSGMVVWQPPAVYKSSCSIDVEFFPYDVQTCVLKLGSWTYDGFKVPKATIKQQPKKKNLKSSTGFRVFTLDIGHEYIFD